MIKGWDKQTRGETGDAVSGKMLTEEGQMQ